MHRATTAGVIGVGAGLATALESGNERNKKHARLEGRRRRAGQSGWDTDGNYVCGSMVFDLARRRLWAAGRTYHDDEIARYEYLDNVLTLYGHNALEPLARVCLGTEERIQQAVRALEAMWNDAKPCPTADRIEPYCGWRGKYTRSDVGFWWSVAGFPLLMASFAVAPIAFMPLYYTYEFVGIDSDDAGLWGLFALVWAGIGGIFLVSLAIWTLGNVRVRIVNLVRGEREPLTHHVPFADVEPRRLRQAIERLC